MNTIPHKYAALEQKLLELIASGVNRHNAICSNPKVRELATPFALGTTSISRVVEGRIRRLRTKHKVTYDSKLGWRATNV